MTANAIIAVHRRVGL